LNIAPIVTLDVAAVANKAGIRVLLVATKNPSFIQAYLFDTDKPRID
jgi:hypothetical protein